MADEYLTRTPSSSGNRSKFTYSCWIKRNKLSDWMRLFSIMDGSTDTIIQLTNVDKLRFREEDTSPAVDYIASRPLRDVGSWMHVLIAIDMTAILAEHRIRMYVNGDSFIEHGLDTESMPGDRDLELQVNEYNREHRFFARNSDSEYFFGEAFDLFWVDGQALTPDVFGFYKDGDGYISVGSSTSTDFKPGQWVPKKPSVIKNSVNNSGGFGANGFYLPMNDSSNFGADFHCDPNTIITLQDETAAQPKNGAPTTSDSYVSQLRSDPYAANLVLAIPGITGGQGSGVGDYSADIKGSGSNKTVTANGNAGIAVTASYYGSAMRFDGNGDYLEVANSSDFDFGNGDFTVEFWTSIDVFGTPGSGIWDGTNDQRSWLVYMNSSRLPRFYVSTDGSSSVNINVSSPAIPNHQWTHLCMERNGPNLVGYVNGVCVGINTELGTQSLFTPVDPLWIGRWDGDPYYTNGYIQDFRVYKGVAKYKGGFDVPKPYTPVATSSSVGFATFRQVPDNCKNNFATLNPLNCYGGTSSTATLTNGNLTQTTTNGNRGHRSSTIGITTGKWYTEVQLQSSSGHNRIGVIADKAPLEETDNVGTSSSEFAYITTGQYAFNSTGTSYGATYTNGDVIGIALNRTDGTITFFKNGTSQGIATDILNNGNYDGQYFHFISADSSLSASGTFSWNFGQNPTFSDNVSVSSTQRNADANGIGQFRYAPPADHLALCEDNLPAPAITDPGDYFKTVLWTGDGTRGRSITGVGFKPDFVWIKKRFGGSARSHQLFDSVRGPSLTLHSDGQSNEDANTNRLISFDENGFTIGNDDGSNGNGDAFVAWCWQAGAGTTSVNTTGTINSVVSVNQEAGFSIVEYDGNNTDSATVGHGLGKIPDLLIIKNRDSTVSWGVWHSALLSGQILRLDTSTEAQTPSTAYFQDENNTSSVFSLGTNNETNSTERFIAYVWAEIEGFSKFGKYIGNGDNDGPFVYCGFKPAWVLIKKIDGSGNENWRLFDSSRSPYNQNNLHLLPSANNAETSESGMDFVSNGFKLRHNDAHQNQDGSNYVYAAFAESPFQTANAK